jgi:UPF0271 protein
MIDINCDVGEGLNNEHLLMPYITSCNIASGGHAGDRDSMNNVVRLAVRHNVKIGIHPSYPDRENFGRKSMELSREDLKNTILEQVQALEKVVKDLNANSHHIKPHGALYNDLAKSHSLTNDFLEIIEPYKNDYKLYVPYNSVISQEAIGRGFNIIYEAFADRNYNDDLSLVSRKEDNALIISPDQIINHISEIVNNNQVRTISGKLMPIKAATFCVHSDTGNAVDIVKRIYQEFQ